jgi:hypothetical protein
MQSDAIEVEVTITTTTPVEDQQPQHKTIRSHSSQLSQIQYPLITENEDHEDEACERHPSRHNKKKINMDEQMLKVNVLSISLAGALIGLGGIALFFTRSFISSRVRYFLPIPPIGVAAYVFVFNMFRFYNATLPSCSNILIEVLLSTLTAALIFFLLVVLMIVSIWMIL